MYVPPVPANTDATCFNISTSGTVPEHIKVNKYDSAAPIANPRPRKMSFLFSRKKILFKACLFFCFLDSGLRRNDDDLFFLFPLLTLALFFRQFPADGSCNHVQLFPDR
jgi:hypothetical protein